MKRAVLLFALGVVGMLVGGAWWIDRRATSAGWQGYVDADFIRVGPTQAGLLVNLSVHRGDNVAAGQPLFSQDDVNDVAARNQAAALLAESEARLTNLQTAGRETEIAQAEAELVDMRAARDRIARDLTRNETLLKSGAASRQIVEQQRDDLASALAHVKAAEAKLEQIRSPTGREFEIAAQQAVVNQQRAALAQAEWRLAQRHVTTPAAARVVDTYALPGEMLAAGTPVVELLPAANILVRFFVPETALPGIHIGERLAIGCDSCTADLTASVSFIAPQAEYTPPVIYSESTRGKLIYLIEADPSPSQAESLKPGQPVTVRPVP